MTAGFPAPRRSRKVYICWGVGLTLLLGAGLICWLVVLPLMRVDAVLGSRIPPPPSLPRVKPEPLSIWPPRDALDKLGGPEKAAGLLTLYYRLPAKFCSRKREAVHLLRQCGKSGEAGLLAALDSRNEDIRIMAAGRLLDGDEFEPESRRSGVGAMIALAGSGDPGMRARAARELGKCREHAALVLPVLIPLAGDSTALPVRPNAGPGRLDQVRDAAIWALLLLGPAAGEEILARPELKECLNAHVQIAAGRATLKMEALKRDVPVPQKGPLAKRVSVDFQDRPIAEAVDHVASSAGVTVIWEKPPPGAKVSLKLTDASAGLALRWLARMSGAGHRAEFGKDNSVRIVSEPLERTRKVHDIEDLGLPETPGQFSCVVPPRLHPPVLANYVKSFVPGNWKPTGGSDVTLEGTKLTVEATATEHRALELFLREWRDYLKRNKVYRAQ